MPLVQCRKDNLWYSMTEEQFEYCLEKCKKIGEKVYCLKKYKEIGEEIYCSKIIAVKTKEAVERVKIEVKPIIKTTKELEEREQIFKKIEREFEEQEQEFEKFEKEFEKFEKEFEKFEIIMKDYESKIEALSKIY